MVVQTIWSYIIMLVWLARTGPSAPAHYSCIGRGTFLDLQAPVALLTLKVLYNALQVYDQSTTL